jgi:hypothetical protein
LKGQFKQQMSRAFGAPRPEGRTISVANYATYACAREITTDFALCVGLRGPLTWRKSWETAVAPLDFWPGGG